MSYAILSNEGTRTVFKFGNEVLRFAAPLTLEYYVKVKSWKDGVITVMTKYSTSDDLVEEYIDVGYVLENLGYDVGNVLNSINEIRIGTVTEWGEVREL